MKQIISAFAIAGTIFFTASCTTSADLKRDAMIKEQQAQLESMRIEMAKKHIIDSMNAVATAKLSEEKAIADQKIVAAGKKTIRRATSKPRVVYTANNSAGYGGAAYTESAVAQQPVYQEVQQPIYQEQRKGWSAKAKGAVIGTAVGAGAGAIINKRNRAAGAVIGAVLGAGAGTGIGAVIDKKNGR